MNNMSPPISSFRTYYQEDLSRLANTIIPKGVRVAEFEAWKKNAVGKARHNSDYILIKNLFSYIPDVQSFIHSLKTITHEKTRIVVVSFSFLWKPILDLASVLGLRVKIPFEPNWLTAEDIENLFRLEGFEPVKKTRRFLLPVNIPVVSRLANRFLAPLPLINTLCLTTVQIFRPAPVRRSWSVSILVAARNEEGNIPGILSKIPKLGTATEVIFVEGHSRDRTYAAIKKEIARYKGPIKAYVYKQSGIGKKDAMALAFKKMRNDLAIILDADLTVSPHELSKFYEAVAAGHADLAIGCRLVYPMEKQAMRTLNYFGNKVFGLAFSFLLGTPIKDTLCGTKAILKKDYDHITKVIKLWGDIDPYGDFDLIFGASKLNFKIVEIPIRYRERTYGTTNISRFEHGLLLLRMTMAAAAKLKFL